ncbi:MAG: hypothetical protein JWM36_4888 [Hyphomicrobiales bacterium]|nr:hypothetical protein [Hyphomicrobiales bacterium]
MKLYTITITAHIDDPDTLDVHLDADVEVSAPSLQTLALKLIPAHLRKVAADTERQAVR